MTEGAEHGTAARIVCVCAALWLLHSDGLDLPPVVGRRRKSCPNHQMHGVSPILVKVS